jgi:hypothetical protein
VTFDLLVAKKADRPIIRRKTDLLQRLDEQFFLPVKCPFDISGDESVRLDEKFGSGKPVAAQLDHGTAEHGKKAKDGILVGT